MDMTITVPTNLVDDFVVGICNRIPIPTDAEGTPQYTQNQWAKLAIQKMIKDMFIKGRTKTYDESIKTDRDNIINTASTDFDLITFNFS